MGDVTREAAGATVVGGGIENVDKVIAVVVVLCWETPVSGDGVVIDMMEADVDVGGGVMPPPTVMPLPAGALTSSFVSLIILKRSH